MAEQYTKDSIKRRMYRHASTLWNVRNTEGLDPTVKLFIEALASEVFKLSGAMHEMETRLLEKVAAALSPDINLIAQPSYAVATALPYPDKMVVTPSDMFIYRASKSNATNKLKSCKFTPAGTFILANAKLKYYVSSNEFCEVGEDYEKETIALLSAKVPRANHKVWLGLRLGDGVTTMGDLSFYVDFPNLSDKYTYLGFLSMCNCHMKSKQVAIECGIKREITDNLINRYNVDLMVNENVLNKYDSHFITIKSSGIRARDLQPQEVPDEISPLLSEKFIQSLAPETIWICIEFPPLFSEDVLSQLKMRLNAFVVMNKYSASISSKIDAASRLVPLTKGNLEHFISIESVYDSQREQLSEVTQSEKSVNKAYSLKRGGAERFNTTDAKNYLSRLTDLLFDESTAFISYNKEALSELVEQLQKQICLLEQCNKEYDGENEQTSYLVIEGDSQEQSTITAKYFLSNGAFANGISYNEKLECLTNVDIQDGTAILLTTTQGGKGSPSCRERMDIYRYLLLSRGQIYTKEDVRNFCTSKYGDYLSSVDVGLGYKQSLKEKEGFVRTIEVCVSPKEHTHPEFMNELCSNIYNELCRYSPQTYNYQVIVNHKINSHE